jgi:hypothetical protein
VYAYALTALREVLRDRAHPAVNSFPAYGIVGDCCTHAIASHFTDQVARVCGPSEWLHHPAVIRYQVERGEGGVVRAE